MGRIKLDCITVNQNNTIIYGIGLAFLNDVPMATKKWGSLVLIRSQPSPSSFQSIRWSVVSTINADQIPIYWDQPFGSVDCAVSKTGVFSAMVRSQQLRTMGDVDWNGFTYDPTLPEGARANDDQWSMFITGRDYMLQSAIAVRAHGAIFLDQPVPEVVAGAPAANGAMRERFIHGISSSDGDVLRLGSFGPKDLDWRSSPPTNWTLATPQNTIMSFPLTNVTGPIPQPSIVKTKEGLTLIHIIPGTHEGASFLVCIGTTSTQDKELYFINNYLNTTAGAVPTTSPSYPVNFLPTMRPLQFVNIPMNSSKELVFGVSITLLGELYGINLTGNQSSTTTKPGQAFTGGFPYVESPYDSFTAKGSQPRGDGESAKSSAGLAAILGGIFGLFLVLFVLFRIWKSRRKNLLKRKANADTPAHPLGAYQSPTYGPPGHGPPQGPGQDFELGAPAVPYNHNPAARHDGVDIPPPYRA
ncbi:hypothetical protein BGW39_010774 [Mortierella sp. 14UC]|nr:hypothetical protein BGW39_010774 [Mortierella sp. 14UC]